MLASIVLDFSPQLGVAGLSIRLDTLALAAAIFAALVAAGVMAGFPGAGLYDRAPDGKPAGPLRRDDLILIAFGVVPGAVIGGRLDYVLVHLDFYQANPNAIFDVNQGGLNLTLAVVGGTLTGIAVARLMSAPIERWLAVLAMPTMFALGAGKLAMMLGGAGQGAYSSADYATSYTGAGPWESLNPSYPSVPSAAIEGLVLLAAMVIIIALPSILRLRLRRRGRLVRPGYADRRAWALLTGGRRFLTMLGIWAVLRFAVASTWRDAAVWNGLNVEQLLLLALVAIAAIGPWAVDGAEWAAATAAREGPAAWHRYRRRREADGEPSPSSTMDADEKLQARRGKVRAPRPRGNAPALVHEAKLPVEDE